MAIYIFAIIYVTFIIGLSIYYSKTSTDEDYLLAGRNRTTFAIMASKFAGAIGVSTFITYTGYAYRFGWGVFIMLVGSIIGYNLFAFWASPIIKRLSVQGKFYTQGDMPAYVTGDKRTGDLANVLTVIIQFFWILLSLVGGAKVIAYFGLMCYPMAVITTCAIVLTYVLLAGFKAVIITDIFQAFIILFFLVFIVFNLIKAENVSLILSHTTESLNPGLVVGLALYGCLSVFGLADRYLLCYAAKNVRSIKLGMSLAVIPVVIIAFLLMIVGLTVLYHKSGMDADTVFIYAMQHQLSEKLIPVLIVMFFAGLMSTADTAIFAVASHAASHSRVTNKVTAVRISSIVVVILATVISFFWESVVDITVVGAALRLTLAVPMIYIILQHKNAGRFKGSLFGGIIGLIGGIFAFGSDPKLALTVLIGSLLGLLYRSKKVLVIEAK
jgi:Na+/proline symporter